ncbi:MAG: type II secretion system protein GspM [Gammaproteobacteria bacterium]|nr:type II secretion system protein GspM [Gammaproteobacteria bacterium]
MDALRDWFSDLAPRERLLVSAAAVLLVLAIVVLGAVRPLNSKAARNAEIVADREALLAELDEVAARLGPQRGGGNPVAASGGQSLVLIVDRTTRGRGLAEFLTRNQPDGDNKIRLRFERAPFDTLIEWLVELQVRHGLSAQSANIDKAPDRGRVNCNLVLTRGG